MLLPPSANTVAPGLLSFSGEDAQEPRALGPAFHVGCRVLDTLFILVLHVVAEAVNGTWSVPSLQNIATALRFAVDSDMSYSLSEG